MTEPTREELQAEIEALRRALEDQQTAAGQSDRPTRDEEAIATGGGSYVSRDVSAGRDFVGRDQNLLLGSVETLRIDSAIFQAAPEAGQVGPRDLLWTYLSQVVRATAKLDLSGVDRRVASSQEDVRLELAAVYTDLNTIRSLDPDRIEAGRGQADLMSKAGQFDLDVGDVRGEDRTLQPVLAFVSEQPYAVVLGDPGSGKTTFTNFLALCLAGELLGMDAVNLGLLGDEWQAGPLLPVRVILRNFAAELSNEEDASQGDLLWRHLVGRIGQSLAGFDQLLRKHLLEEGGLLILDGLDEVPEARKRRKWVRAAILDFKRQYPRVRVLITSRTYAYQQQAWQLPDFENAVLAPFDTEQIERFIDRWYVHMAHVRSTLSVDDAAGRAVLLKQAIANNAYLRDLAPRPLLLTLMASLHAWRGGSLPEQREQLYDESVELLLDIWEQPKIVRDRAGEPLVQTESVTEWLRTPRERVRKALDKLAYEVHAEQTAPTGTADIREEKLVHDLLEAAADPELKPMRVMEYIQDRAGLLINRGEGVYSFPHRTFQEYLAACHLTDSGFPNTLVRLVRDDAERWREVLLLAGAKVARGTPFAAWSLVAKLCPQFCDPARARGVTDSEWKAALLASQVLLETNIHATLDEAVDTDNLATLAHVVSWLRHLLEGGYLPIGDRADAGVALGRLADPRPGVGWRDGAPDIAWVEVEAGPFVMGSDKAMDSEAWSAELPQFMCDLIRQHYRISRYPITVAQYRPFVEAGGYERKAYWTEMGWAWRAEQNVTGPESYGEVFATPNHPQVGVSWYEAVAYCCWLSEVTAMEVRLPTEWERAARHTDGRIYPWGNRGDPATHSNMNETGIGSTSAVGIFPLGDAVCGAADMSGNVREWCSTKWLGGYDDYVERVDDDSVGSERRVLRGGSFSLDRRVVRCACRYGWSPLVRSGSSGFRVLSPGPWRAGR